MKSILLYNSGGGLGDSIQLFSLILSLKSHFKSAEFLYLGAHDNHFEGKLKGYNIRLKTLDLNLKYFGFRWWHLFLARKRFNNLDLEKIDLIIDLQSKFRNTMILKKIPHNHFYSKTFNFRFSSKKYDFLPEDHLSNLSKFLNAKIIKIQFNIKDLSSIYQIEAKRLLPDNNYIGFSITQGNVYRKKSWSIENVIHLANKIEIKNKIPVFFIEKEKKDIVKEIKSRVPNALFPEHQSKFSSPALVTALTTRLNLSISIDNGIMHMMSLANKPMIVLFGPTDSEKFAPKNKHVKVLDSKKIYNTKDINSITVYDVFKLI